MLGTVIQDVVADAMSTEVVARVDTAGNARAEDEIRAELGMVQVLGRLALSIGILAVAGLSGWLAQFLARDTVFLLGLIIPALSILGRKADPQHVLVGADLRCCIERTVHLDLQQGISTPLQHLLKRSDRCDLLTPMGCLAQ